MHGQEGKNRLSVLFKLTKEIDLVQRGKHVIRCIFNFNCRVLNQSTRQQQLKVSNLIKLCITFPRRQTDAEINESRREIWVKTISRGS